MRFWIVAAALLNRLAIGFHSRFRVSTANVSKAHVRVSFRVNSSRLLDRYLIGINRSLRVALPRKQVSHLEMRFGESASLLFDGLVQFAHRFGLFACAN